MKSEEKKKMLRKRGYTKSFEIVRRAKNLSTLPFPTSTFPILAAP
jgi:hypothetical protein